MAAGINRVTILGHVGKDPEIKTTAGGLTMANISIATTESWKDKSGEWVKNIEWHNLTLFGKQASLVEAWVIKGTLVYVEGKLKTDKWEDKKTGEKRSKLAIHVDNIQVLNSPLEKKEEKPFLKVNAKNDFDDDIPF